MIRLPRLPQGWQNQPQLFERYWDEALRQIETNFNQILALPGIEAAIVAAQASADAANSAASSANSAASAANDAAADAAAMAALTNSGVVGATLTATDAGSNVTVTISAHTRLYGNGTSVSVTGGSVTALSYSTDYYIYYDQASRAGGSVTYLATTNKLTAAQTGDRHLVGVVTTPAAAGPPLDGFYVEVSGIGNIPV